MNKKTIFFIFLIGFIEIFYTAEFTKAEYFTNFNYIKTDKEIYFYNETIEIEASWELDYNNSTEDAYFQIRICDYQDNPIWMSSEFYDRGALTKKFTVIIQELDLSSTEYSNILFIRFYYWLKGLGGSYYKPMTIQVELKRLISCKLTGLKDNIEIGENMSICAKFSNKFWQNNTLLENKTVFLFVYADNTILKTENHTINSYFMIEFVLSTVKDLKIGNNILILIIDDDEFYNYSKFEYEIKVNISELKNLNSEIQLNYISLFSIITISILIFSIIILNNKKSKRQDLASITFRF